MKFNNSLNLIDIKYNEFMLNLISNMRSSELLSLKKGQDFDANLDYKIRYKFTANLESSELDTSSYLNKNINKFIDVESFRKENDLCFRDILSESTTGLFPSLGVFNNVFKNQYFLDVYQVKNRRLLTSTNNLVLPTTH
jgi:hypothetical protein